jgi:nucleoside-diphosphate-sugar epimerase
MSASKERVFVTGASGGIGSGVVRGLVKNKIDTTAYVRNEQKAKDLFKDELNTDYLTLVIGTYSTIEVYKKAIQGHTRLFLLVADVINKPASMSQIKETFGKIAFEQGVRQIVDLSSASVGSSGKEGIIGYMHTTAEEKLWTLADENPEERSLVVLRPAAFMTNHFMGDIHHVKRSDQLVSCAFPSSVTTWIDTAGKYKITIVIIVGKCN